jgi:hypothetical protein
MLKPISMMLQTLKLFVKPSLDLTCGSCRSKPLSSKPYWHFTGVVRASSNSEPHKPIKSGVIGRIWHCRPRGIQQLQRRLPELVEDADNPLPVLFRTQLSLLQHHMAYLFDVIATLDKQIEQCYRQNALCQRIGKIPGIGPVTASALIATIGKANNFENGRQLAARLPRIGSTSALQWG